MWLFVSAQPTGDAPHPADYTCPDRSCLPGMKATASFRMALFLSGSENESHGRAEPAWACSRNVYTLWELCGKWQCVPQTLCLSWIISA